MSDSSVRKISDAQGWFGLKRLFKRSIPRLPFYNSSLFMLRPYAEHRDWIKRIPVAKTGVDVSNSKASVRLMNTDRCEIAKRLWWSSGRVEPVEDSNALLIFQFACERAQIALDIGCNTGLFSLMAAKANSNLQVLSFDLLPEAISLATENVIVNDLADQVFPVLLGIGEPRRMKVPLIVDASSVPTSLSTDFDFDQGVSVKIVTLDSLSLFVPKKANVAIKIDVEATEHDIFRFGCEFLGEHSPDIICELLKRSRVSEFEGQLKALGYSFFLIGPDGIHPKERLKPHPQFRDWLFTRRPESFSEFVEPSAEF